MFTDTMMRYVNNLNDGIMRLIFKSLFTPLFDGKSSCALDSAGLAINGAGEGVAKAANTCHFLANGVMVEIAADTQMPALVGTVAADTFNYYAFFVDSAGNLTSQMGTAGTTLATAKLPQKPVGKAMIGFIIINPTGTGDFVGGTTDLDDATVVPNAVYVNTIGSPDQYCVTGL